MTLKTIDQQAGEDESIIFIEGELDIFTIDYVIKKIDEQLASKCALDFSGVTFIDSSGIGLLIRKIMDWRDEDKLLTFTNMRNSVREVMEQMGAFDILEEVYSQ